MRRRGRPARSKSSRPASPQSCSRRYRSRGSGVKTCSTRPGSPSAPTRTPAPPRREPEAIRPSSAGGRPRRGSPSPAARCEPCRSPGSPCSPTSCRTSSATRSVAFLSSAIAANRPRQLLRGHLGARASPVQPPLPRSPCSTGSGTRCRSGFPSRARCLTVVEDAPQSGMSIISALSDAPSRSSADSTAPSPTPGPRHHPEPRQLQHPRRLLPARQPRGHVGPEQEIELVLRLAARRAAPGSGSCRRPHPARPRGQTPPPRPRLRPPASPSPA